MRYIDATCSRINRHLEGSVAFVATRVTVPVELSLRGGPAGQAMEAQTQDTEVLLTV